MINSYLSFLQEDLNLVFFCLLPPGLSSRKVASLHQLVDGVEEEDAHGEEEQGGEGSLVHSLDG